MKRFVGIVVLVLMVGAIVLFFKNFRIEPQYENGNLVSIKIVPRDNLADVAAPVATNEPAPRPFRPAFRIATFNLDGLDSNKLASPRVSGILLRVLSRYELIAVQGLQGKNQAVIMQLTEMLNAAGRQYGYAIGPEQIRSAAERYSAFLYDRTALEIDRTTVHYVQDPMNRFRRSPLVGAFRTRGIEPSQAFTFTLINVEIDPDRVVDEVNLLADVRRAVRDDGRKEDDIIMLGDFETDEKRLGELGKSFDVVAAISAEIPTTAEGTAQTDNILMSRRATIEFTGRGDVVDMLREFELTRQGAAEVSRHLPVWAEFSAYEGAQHGFAPTPQPVIPPTPTR